MRGAAGFIEECRLAHLVHGAVTVRVSRYWRADATFGPRVSRRWRVDLGSVDHEYVDLYFGVLHGNQFTNSLDPIQPVVFL